MVPLALALLLVVALGDSPSSAAGWRFTLPAGSASAGEQVFVKMECYACHTVAGKRFGDPTQNPGGIGPDLTARQARMPREYLAESIINIDRFIAHGRRRERYVAGDGTSRMAQYNDLLTVRELIDLVEFLKAIH